MNEIQTIVEATKRALEDFEFFCANCFYIIDKDGNIRTLEFNSSQRKIWNVVKAQMRKKKPIRIVILKPRQIGVSTFFCALDVWLMLKRTVKCVLVAHKEDANKEVYGIVRFAVEHLPDWFKRALNIKIDISSEGVAFSHTFSEMNIYTAGGKEIGRAGTKQVLHLTEVAFYPDPEAVTGSLFASFPETPGTVVVQESTGNGPVGYFPDLYNAAKNGKNAYVPIFIPWYEHEEYQMEVPEDAEIIVPDNLRKLYEQGKITKEQLYWRQYTIANKYNGNEDLFRREYPSCVAEGSRVATNKGIVKIEESYGATGVETGRISGVICKGIRETVVIETEKGFRVEVTPDHLVKTANRGFVQAQDLTQDDSVVLSPPIFSEELAQVVWNPMPGYESKIVVDEKCASFLGYFMGDGSFSNTKSGPLVDFACCAEDEDVCQDVVNLCINISGRIPSIRFTGKNKGCFNIRSHHKEWFDYLTKLGAIKQYPKSSLTWSGRYVRKVCVPEVIFRSPKFIVKEFLSSLFEADGCAYKDRPSIRFFTKYEQFARDIQLLLLGFGIVATLSKKKSRKKKLKSGEERVYEGYEISLNVLNALRFYDEIGFRSKRKNEIGHYRRSVTRRGRKPQEIVFFDKVRSVTPGGKKAVYDIIMPEEPHAFGANGVLVHNCEDEAWFQNAPTFFPFTLVSKRIREVENIPYDQGDIAQFGNSPEFVPLVEGDLRIYKYPQAGRRYIIGGDASSGVSTSTAEPDKSSADILDAETGEQVASISALIEPVEFGKKLYLLGLYYNTALISVEVNDGHGMTVMNYLRDMGYTMLYMRRVYDQVNKQWISKLGWSTTSKTRPLMLDKLKSAFKTGAIIVNDSRTLSEMLAFVKNEKGKFVAAKGARDDAVMSLAIANIAREEYKSMLMVDSAGANSQAREVNPAADVVLVEQDFFHNVRKKHLYPDRWVHPELGVYY